MWRHYFATQCVVWRHYLATRCSKWRHYLATRCSKWRHYLATRCSKWRHYLATRCGIKSSPLSLAVCVYVYPVWVHICSHVANILKQITYMNRTFPVEWRKSRSSTSWLWSSFQSQNCWNFIIVANISLMMRDRANRTISIRYEVRYLQSKGAIANVMQRDLDRYFQCHKISGASES